MKKMHFEISINSSPERVYEIMLNPGHYAAWTMVFNPDSRFEGSWDKGSRIYFLGTDKDGITAGMVSRIAENIRGRFVSIEHLSEIRNGIEIADGPDTGKWKGARENYTFSEEDGKTKLSVDVDVVEEFIEYFNGTWPAALLKLKEICERY
ncbi:MAG: SRPBCC domain-containing protein [Bacteroidales bacterium]|nr:SRPBCC domain-containing protein [Bacteroidales bacterium]